MNFQEHLLTCLAEECGEVMDILYLEPDQKDKLEYELNDIVSVAHMLHDNDFVVGDLNPRGSESSHKYWTGDFGRDMYFLAKEIHYFTCKSLRFGLYDYKPGSSRSNKMELEHLISQLILLLKNNKLGVHLWEREKLKTKEKKVIANCELAIKNKTLTMAAQPVITD